ncbi:MAG: MBL fold metallo-hydrolase [Desulfurococcales archaeon]|nr:MBL fold metallo-hydrolase [Desulfurococcales archaeon]
MEKATATASVSTKGAILLGKNVVVDGFDDRPIRVVTHAHFDHIGGLKRSIKRSVFIVATPTTLKMLEVLGYKIPPHKTAPLPYGRSLMVEDERLTLFPSRHIAGSAQVLVEGPNYRVAYTGDFKMPGTPPIRDLDVLVLDATYGSPRRQRRWSDWEALMALIGLIEEKSKYGPVWVYGYNGKLQEVMVELRKSGVRLPFYADIKTIKLAKIAAEFYRERIEDLYPYNGAPIDESAVIFQHMSRSRSFKTRRGTHIILTGWEMRGIIVQVEPNKYNVSYSDHATLREIVDYLRAARPRIIIVDAYRGRDPELTARHIEKITGIRTIPLPV